MGKAINEKTFEINITSELINKSKLMAWSLTFPYFHLIRPDKYWDYLISAETIFCEGLTQAEESNPETGGYDTTISFLDRNRVTRRLMFLQFKAGYHRERSNNPNSIFCKKSENYNGGDTKHILFTFNDAAEGTQHSTLRKLSQKNGVKPKSVMYVFPRITTKEDFDSNIGRLSLESSFVPVVDIDEQGSNQTPSVTIIDGTTHKYRTSYDGQQTELNKFFFFFDYEKSIIREFLTELTCVHIERILQKFEREEDKKDLPVILDLLEENINSDSNSPFIVNRSKEINLKTIKNYIKKVRAGYIVNEIIMPAPSKFTSIIPENGIKISLNDENYHSSLKYQIF